MPTSLTEYSLTESYRRTSWYPDCRAANRSATRILAVLALITAVPAFSASAELDSSAAPPTEEQSAQESVSDEIAVLARNLGHRQFAVREAATQELKTKGKAAVEPVTQAALAGSLESGLRAVSILHHIFQSEDDEAFDAAEHSLAEILTEAEHAAVAQRAERVLNENQFSVTQRRSVARVRELGGQVQMERERQILINGEPMRPRQGWALTAAIGKRWKGGAEGLRHLARLKTLMTIYLIHGHQLSDGELQQLQLDLPNVTFQKRGAAMLGVSTGPDTLGCSIGTVRPDSGAGDAGMRTGDVVVEIAGEGVRSPEDLISIIGTKDAGETVEIVILRGDPILRYKLMEVLNQPGQFSPLLAIAILNQMRTTVSVKLGEWNIDNG